MEKHLQDLERDVEDARARLLANLSLMSSPATFGEFKSDLRVEARSTLRGILEDVKGRAAANPAATLAIGAGLAWRLLRDPPIATALIGAGLFGLWRTMPARPVGNGYLSTATTRLGEQVGDVASSVGEHAAQITGTLRDNVSDIAEVASEKIHAWGSDISAEIAHQAGAMSQRASSALNDTSRSMNTAVAPSETRDVLLLGTAGLAVAAALGIAYQRRTSDAPQ